MKLAAVDLGSNSFRLEIARVENDGIFTETTWKETVRLAAGLDKDGNLTEEAQERALAALSRIAEKLRGFPSNRIRAVGTQTLRAAKNSAEFLSRAQEVLGHKIEILRGKEEARLVFEGCSYALPASDRVRLIVDIGGASTECVLGIGHEVIDGESFHIGCVNTSVRFFKGGRITAQAFREAVLSCESVLAGGVTKFIRGTWEEAFGSSGTVSAVSEILAHTGISDGVITLEALEKLRDRIIAAGDIGKLNFEGLKEDRREVLAGGVAVLLAVFNKLHIDKMQPAGGALRYGLLVDLAGRKDNRDPRQASVEGMLHRFNVDTEQSERAARTALRLFKLEEPRASEEELQTLAWAARLFEIGLTLSRSDYHKHGDYIIRNSDMAGFSRSEQERIAALVLAHRGSLKKVENLLKDREFRRMVFALRLAAIFVHSRRATLFPNIEIKADSSGFEVRVPKTWCEEHPLTAYMLEQEVPQWEKAGYHLKLDLK